MDDLVPHPGRLLVSLVNDTHFEVDDMSENLKCPSTHFECPVSRNCMPLFLRCNGRISLVVTVWSIVAPPNYLSVCLSVSPAYISTTFGIFFLNLMQFLSD